MAVVTLPRPHYSLLAASEDPSPTVALATPRPLNCTVNDSVLGTCLRGLSGAVTWAAMKLVRQAPIRNAGGFSSSLSTAFSPEAHAVDPLDFS